MSLVKTHTLHDDEGVTTKRSQDGLHICLPVPLSANHEIAIASVLWRLWIVARSEVRGTASEWIVELCGDGDVSIVLGAIIAVIRVELGQAGGKLMVVYSPHSSAPDSH